MGNKLCPTFQKGDVIFVKNRRDTYFNGHLIAMALGIGRTGLVIDVQVENWTRVCVLVGLEKTWMSAESLASAVAVVNPVE